MPGLDTEHSLHMIMSPENWKERVLHAHSCMGIDGVKGVHVGGVHAAICSRFAILCAFIRANDPDTVRLCLLFLCFASLFFNLAFHVIACTVNLTIKNHPRVTSRVMGGFIKKSQAFDGAKGPHHFQGNR